MGGVVVEPVYPSVDDLINPTTIRRATKTKHRRRQNDELPKRR
jgi:hypothetical protein